MPPPDSNPPAERSALVVEDSTVVRTTLAKILAQERCTVSSATAAREAIDLLGSRKFDLVITDLHMEEDDSGFEVIRAARSSGQTCPILVVSGHADIHKAVRLIKLGAYDVVEKPFQLSELRAIIHRALEQKSTGDEAAPDTDPASEDPFHGIIGSHPSLQRVFGLVSKVADTDSTVLITGESGTGKELIARSIHRASPRRDELLLTVNCGAIPENLIESELFGSVKGAYTGSTQDRKGRFEQASGGSLFLDEIGEMPLALQVKLLRVLQEGEFYRVGDSVPRTADVRIVAATNRNLEEEVAEGRFREDLYYRLSVFPIHMPPLRQRVEDIPELARHFLARFNAEHRRTVAGFSDAALDTLMQYPWPGNIRELQNVVERVVIVKGDGGVVGPRDLPAKVLLATSDNEFAQELLQRSQRASDVVDVGGAGHEADLEAQRNATTPVPKKPLRSWQLNFNPDGIDLPAELSRLEKEVIDAALELTGGNRSEAARMIGIKRTTLVEKLRRRAD